MDGPRDYHVQWSKLEKDKYHMISFTSGSKKLIQMNLFRIQKKTQQTEKMGGVWEGETGSREMPHPDAGSQTNFLKLEWGRHMLEGAYLGRI